jgi:hypothetical protein
MRWISAVSAALIVLPTLALDAEASCAARTRISGLWKGSDGGTYAIRRIDNNVIWWMGQSADDGKSWTNVFKGVFDGKKTITGEWVDVRGWKQPKDGQGRLTLELIGTEKALSGFKRVSATGAPFGATTWSFSCE